jgi:FAD/FMN-containing dehydrogenase
METVIQGSTLQTLRAGLRGTAHAPGEEGYEEASRAWNLAAHQSPALVVVANGAADVMAAVRFAWEGGLGVGVMATGHGVSAACDGGVLINTSGMRGVRVDPLARTARVEAGALWTDLIHESQVHGQAGLLGSTSYVGIVGYTMGGGFGWLGRKYGFNAASVREADLVTADGELVRVSAEEHPDLFWGLGGGGGNFGIVTSLKFDLYPIGMLYGGNLIYPVEKAREVLNAYARWSADLPDEMTSGVAFLNVPPLPALPELLRGKSVIALRGCYCGETPGDGEELVRPMREELGEPIMDTFGMMPYAAMDSISMDPVDPMGTRQHSELMSDLSRGYRDARRGSRRRFWLAPDRAGDPAARRRPRAHRRPLEHHGQGRLQIHHERGGAGLHAGDGRRGRGLPRPRGRRDTPLPDRRHLRQLYGARRRERREGEGRLRARGLRPPRRPQGPLRPAKRLPLQPQHRPLEGRALKATSM